MASAAADAISDGLERSRARSDPDRKFLKRCLMRAFLVDRPAVLRLEVKTNDEIVSKG